MAYFHTHKVRLLCCAMVCAAVKVVAQDLVPAGLPNGGFDEAYVLDRTDMLTTRFYVSNKFNAMDLDDQETAAHLEYRPNTNVNLGIGASYRALTLNIGVGFPFLNSDDSLRGKTNYLDAQGNMYGRRFAINVFAQTYRGYYIDQVSLAGVDALAPQFLNALAVDRLRRDMRQQNLGLSVMHIVKNERFSYRAAFNQDAWQRRSAGSVLVGGSLVFQGMRADRSAIPIAVEGAFDAALRFRRIDLFELGGMVGYAHTFVFKQHVFTSLSVSLGPGMVHGRSRIAGDDGAVDDRFWSVGLHSQARVALGYNSALTYVGLSYVNEQSRTPLAPQAIYGWNVGNFRLFVTYRFHARIHLVDAVMRRLQRL